MFRFIETIKIENKQIENISFHNKRINDTFFYFFKQNINLNINNFIDLNKIEDNSRYKYRLIYDNSGILEISCEKYFPKTIQTLKAVHSNNIDYSFKYENREALNKLYLQRENCDDILIIKNNFITDTYYANIVFFDGKNWYTPDSYLLNGTKRQELLQNKKISETSIKIFDIYDFRYFSIINAMLSLGEIKIDVKNILI